MMPENDKKVLRQNVLLKMAFFKGCLRQSTLKYWKESVPNISVSRQNDWKKTLHKMLRECQAIYRFLLSLTG